MHAQSLRHVWYFEIPRTVACQTPLSMEFSRQEYWRGLPFPNPGLEDIHTLKLQVFPNSSPCNIPLGVAYSKLSFLKLPCALIALLAGASQQPFSQLQYPFLESQRPISFPLRARGPNPTDVLRSNTSAHATQKQLLPPPNSLIFHLYVSQDIYHTLFCITIIYRYVRSQLPNHFLKKN